MYEPSKAFGSREGSAAWMVRMCGWVADGGCTIEERWFISVDFPEEGGDERIVGRRVEYATDKSTRADSSGGVGI